MNKVQLLDLIVGVTLMVSVSMLFIFITTGRTEFAWLSIMGLPVFWVCLLIYIKEKQMPAILCSRIELKVRLLRRITKEFLFIERARDGQDYWMIRDEFTKFGLTKIRLCPVSDGIERAVSLALGILSNRKKKQISHKK